MAFVDFTLCEIDRIANYGGSDKKRGIIYHGKRYMLKLSDRIPEEKRNLLNSSYSNSAYSEHIGCLIMRSMGFDVQNTLLGTIQLKSHKGEDKVYPVVACENFVPEHMHLVEFKMIENALLDEKPPKVPKIEHLYEIMGEENEYFSADFGRQSLQFYWDLFIADALLGNFDRHANNWGYFVHDQTGQIVMAPVYDCGSCLYPQIADDAIVKILGSKEEMQKRIDVFPTAALCVNDQKVSYKKFISSFANKDCTNALDRMHKKIDLNKIHSIVNGISEISDIRKEFYNTMINERYRQIIHEPYLKLQTMKRYREDLVNDNMQDYSAIISQISTDLNVDVTQIATKTNEDHPDILDVFFLIDQNQKDSFSPKNAILIGMIDEDGICHREPKEYLEEKLKEFTPGNAEKDLICEEEIER